MSKNGLISHSTATGSDHDSGIWVETSENVQVLYSHVEGNVNGFEVSNSDDILLAHNTVRGNTFINNGSNPGGPPQNPFFFAASDMVLLTSFKPFVPEPIPPYHGNCYENNAYSTFFSLFLGVPGVSPDPPTCE